jgi:hypothetical protein
MYADHILVSMDGYVRAYQHDEFVCGGEIMRVENIFPYYENSQDLILRITTGREYSRPMVIKLIVEADEDGMLHADYTKARPSVITDENSIIQNRNASSYISLASIWRMDLGQSVNGQLMQMYQRLKSVDHY